jgi:hypothetical protein
MGTNVLKKGGSGRGGSNEDNASDVRDTNKTHEDLSDIVAQNMCLRWELLCLFAHLLNF